MAFLGDFGKALGAAVKNPIVQTVFPVFAVGNALALAAGSKLSNALQPSQRKSSLSAQGPQSPYVIYPQQTPQYQQYQVTPGGSYLAQDFAPPFSNFGGFQSWDYSTPSPTYFPQTMAVGFHPSSTSDRSWEDLISLGVGVASFL